MMLLCLDNLAEVRLMHALLGLLGHDLNIALAHAATVVMSTCLTLLLLVNSSSHCLALLEVGRLVAGARSLFSWLGL